MLFQCPVKNPARRPLHIIVRVHKQNIIAVRLFNAQISCRRQPAVFLMPGSDLRKTLCITVAERTASVIASIVDQQNLRLFLHLFLMQKRVHASVQTVFHVIYRYDDGKPVFSHHAVIL